ncbi:MAG: DHHA1 domain-containing protein, partial [Rhodospirillales bacterium]
EAVTGQAALDYLTEQEGRLSAVAATLKVAPSDVPARVVSLIEERRKLERELADARKALATGGGGGAAKPEAEEINGVKFTSRVLEGMPPKELKGMADELMKQPGSGVVVVISGNEGKASIVVAVTPDMTDKISAVDLVRVGSEALGGKGGGGRPDMAQAGGPDASKAGAAVDAIRAHIAG